MQTVGQSTMKRCSARACAERQAAQKRLRNQNAVDLYGNSTDVIFVSSSQGLAELQKADIE